ncbi:hypothetical protein BVRB_3g056870 [Beta vulgaris subsp. vulgaris]|nr:hypothetical protein BVRB_3g056870 [Beta vulgaris subsp. vulgaris]
MVGSSAADTTLISTFPGTPLLPLLRLFLNSFSSEVTSKFIDRSRLRPQ